MLAIEEMSLRALSELEQMETGIDACVEVFSPESMAVFMQVFGRHLLMNSNYLQIAMAIDMGAFAHLASAQQGSAGMDERAY